MKSIYCNLLSGVVQVSIDEYSHSKGYTFLKGVTSMQPGCLKMNLVRCNPMIKPSPCYFRSIKIRIQQA